MAAEGAAEGGDVVEAAVQRDFEHAALAVQRAGEHGMGAFHAGLGEKAGKGDVLPCEQALHLAWGEMVQARDGVQAEVVLVAAGTDVALDQGEPGQLL